MERTAPPRRARVSLCNDTLVSDRRMSRRSPLAGSRKGTRGAATKARLLSAATHLFLDRGYVDTTVAAIAKEAGVALQTLYLSFGSKVAILRPAHDVAVVGDD